MVFWDGLIPEHIFTIEIFLGETSVPILKSQMQVRPKEGRISSPHIVSTLHLNVMKWKEDVGVFTRYATFLAMAVICLKA